MRSLVFSVSILLAAIAMPAVGFGQTLSPAGVPASDGKPADRKIDKPDAPKADAGKSGAGKNGNDTPQTGAGKATAPDHPMPKSSEADLTCRSMLPALMAKAEKGDALSAYRVGVIYDTGCGVRGDQQVAAAYYEMAAKGGDVDGAVHLGMIYVDGEALRQDYDKARHLLAGPAKAGHPLANYYLGVIAYRGDEVKPAKPDVATAMKYFRAAADGGLAQAQFIIGQAAAEGIELPKDGKLAKLMLLRAAAQGHGWAQAILGRLLTDNELPDSDPVEAMTWLSIAKRDNADVALLVALCDANLKKLEAKLTPAQLKQAQDRIAAYAPRREWEEKI
jgi:TPR repeat protein